MCEIQLTHVVLDSILHSWDKYHVTLAFGQFGPTKFGLSVWLQALTFNVITGILDRDTTSSIKPWRINSFADDNGNFGEVTCLLMDEEYNFLYCGNSNNTVSVWSLLTGELKDMFYSHTSKVTCIARNYDKNLLISGSDDRTISFWDLSTFSNICKLSGHTDGILCLGTGTYVLASGSRDHTAKIWDFRKSRVIKKNNPNKRKYQPYDVSCYDDL